MAKRYDILLKCITNLNLTPTVIQVAGNSHIFIFPPGKKSIRSSKGVFPFRGESPFMLTAHYDRVPESPGANDNSIAVFHLLRTAAILAKRALSNWIIVFTDKEELIEGETFEDQGSFTLAEKLKDWGMEKSRIFNFDACGCGNAFIFSTTTDHILKNSSSPNAVKVRENIAHLRDHALKTANLLQVQKALLAPTPFSDDAGFLRGGIAAQTITILPLEEANQYEALLRDRSTFADMIISGAIKDAQERRRLPQTWRSLNTGSDTPSRLTPEFFEQVVQFAVELCR
jgi:hypothetical protein